MYVKETVGAVVHRARPALTIAAVIALLWVVQDMILVFWDHQQFAQSIICTDAAIRRSGGRYADEHCVTHGDLGNVYLMRAWILAVYEVHSFKCFVAALAVLVL